MTAALIVRIAGRIVGLTDAQIGAWIGGSTEPNAVASAMACVPSVGLTVERIAVSVTIAGSIAAIEAGATAALPMAADTVMDGAISAGGIGADGVQTAALVGANIAASTAVFSASDATTLRSTGTRTAA